MSLSKLRVFRAYPLRRCISLLLLSMGLAAGLSAQQPTKIAVVDLEGLFFSATEGRSLQTKLADLEKTTKEELDRINQSLQAIRQEAAGKPALEQRDAARRIEDGERNARRIADSAKRQAGKIEQDARKTYNNRLEPLLRQIQEDEGFDLILNKTPGIVVFASAAIDVSQSLLAKLDQTP